MNESASSVHKVAYGAALGIAFAATTACTSVPPPRAELAQAERAVDQALRGETVEFAALEAGSAREKLNQARAAMQEERYPEARRLAEQALVDAELAQAKAEAARRGRSAEEMEKTIESLREEAQRSRSVDPLPSPSP